MLKAGSGAVVTKRVDQRVTPAPGTIKVARKQGFGGAPVIVLDHIPVSSTSEDRDGDEFSARGLKDLKAQYDAGKVPYYCDHGKQPGDFMPSYSVLDMLGKWTSATVEGRICYGTAELDGGDPRAVELARKVEAGLPIGHSVGFMVLEAEPKVDEKGNQTGKLIFHAVDLMETSAVGIPSNPDAVNDALTVLARTKGLSIDALRQRLGIPPERTDMELTPKETQQIEAQRKAKLDGEAEAKTAPVATPTGGLTLEGLKTALEAQAVAIKTGLVEALKAAAPEVKAKDDKPKDDDEDDPKKAKDPKDDDEEDKEAPAPDEKAAKKPKAKTAPKAIVVHDDKDASKDSQPDDAKEWRPFQFATQ